MDPIQGGANVTIRCDLDGRPLRLNLGPRVRDFLDLAVSVYIADEIVGRESSPDYWSRRFELLWPVKDVPLWALATGTLQRTLHTLCGDHFDFAWLPRAGLPAMKSHRTTLPSGYDTVCLFSGGIDSLLGAYRLLSAGKRVLLVGHQADSLTASAQTGLATELARMFPQRVRLVQVRVARSQGSNQRFALPEKVEDSHRTRSFLFLGLAVSIANAARITEVVMPENGLIALNPPLQLSRIGTLSTRTAHPLFLSLLLGLLKETGIYTGTIKNPFLYQKQDRHAPERRSIATRDAAAFRVMRARRRPAVGIDARLSSLRPVRAVHLPPSSYVRGGPGR